MTEQEYVTRFLIIEARLILAAMYYQRQPERSKSNEKELQEDLTTLVYTPVNWNHPI